MSNYIIIYPLCSQCPIPFRILCECVVFGHAGLVIVNEPNNQHPLAYISVHPTDPQSDIIDQLLLTSRRPKLHHSGFVERR